MRGAGAIADEPLMRSDAELVLALAFFSRSRTSAAGSYCLSGMAHPLVPTVEMVRGLMRPILLAGLAATLSNTGGSRTFFRRSRTWAMSSFGMGQPLFE